MNLGDTVVILSAYLLGPAWGSAASGLGSALADLFSGYTAYVPGTLVIKALMAACAAWIYLLMKKRAAALPVAAVAAEAIMVAGYWLYDALLAGSLIGAAAGIPSNLVQSALGIAASTVLPSPCAAQTPCSGSSHICKFQSWMKLLPSGRQFCFAGARKILRAIFSPDLLTNCVYCV